MEPIDPLKLIIAVGIDNGRISLAGQLAAAGHHVKSLARMADLQAAIEADSADCVFIGPDKGGLAAGLAAVRAIRESEAANGRFVHIALLVDKVSAEVMAEGYQAGATWILPRNPDAPTVLSLLSLLAGARRSKLAELRAAQAQQAQAKHSEEDKQNEITALRVMRQLAGVESQPLAQVQSQIVPARRFSGDQVVAERTPTGVLHLFLADGVGHGLAAALLVLPLTRTFSTMSRKGFALPAIVSELNSNIRKYRMADQFVAATLAAFDPLTGQLEVWNGGNPDGLLVGRDGAVLRRFQSLHLPLGLLPCADLDTRTESIHAPDDSQLLLYSDGLIEAAGGSGASGPFGEAGVLASAASCAPAERVQAVVADVRRHLAGGEAHDDISVVAMECGKDMAELPGAAIYPLPVEATVAAEAPQWNGEDEWSLTLKLGTRTLKSVDCIPVIQNFLREMNPSVRDFSRQIVVLSELFNNALDHGLLKLDSHLKDGPEGFGQYMEERARRLAELDGGEIVIEAAGADINRARALRLKVRDSGSGFEHKEFLEPAKRDPSPATPYGRGISLVRSLADEFHYEGQGNVVHAICCSNDTENREVAA